MKTKIVVPLMILLMVCVVIVVSDNGVEGATIADFSYSPYSPEVGEEVTFDASRSYGEGLDYKWDFGDGSKASGAKVTHTFEDYGTHTVVLVVTDSEGTTDIHTEDIYVSDDFEGGEFIAFFMLAYFGIYILIIFIFIALIITHLIVGGVLAYKLYKDATDNNRMEIAKPYLIAHLIAGIIGFVMTNFVLFAIIAHIVIYYLYKDKLKKIGYQNTHNRPTRPTAVPRTKIPRQ